MTLAKCVGFFDRNGIKPGTGNQTTGDDFNTSRGNSAWPNNAWNAYLGGFVMRSITGGGSIPWSEMQATGEANTATGVGATSLTRTGAGWTVNQWTNGVVSMGGAPSGGGSYAYITSNTSTQLNFSAWVGGQPAAGAYVLGGPLGGTAGAGVSAIDHSFYVADGYNHTNPTHNWTCKLRIFYGENAPTWAQNLGVGPINDNLSTNNTTAWWDATYEQSYENFMLLLGQYVPTYTVTWTGGGQSAGANTLKLDGHPLFGEVTEAACMTKYAEPCMKDDFKSNPNTEGSGMDSALDAGMTDNAELNLSGMTGTQTSAMLSMVQAFPNSCWSFSHNPFIEVGNNAAKNIAKTTALTDYLVGHALNPAVTPNCGAAFPQAVMENNSLKANTGANFPGCATQNGGAYSDRDSDYTTMYTKFAGYTDAQAADDLALPEVLQPQPLCIQTSTYSIMGGTVASLKNTITYALWLGARMIELPGDGGGYTNIATSDAWWTSTVPLVYANDPVASGGIPPISNLRRKHWHSFTHH